MSDIWLITGIPGAGKTTSARLLTMQFTLGVHIEGEQLQGQIVAGGVWPGDEPLDESRRQLTLCDRNQCLLAQSYTEAGFNVVMDHVVASRDRLREYQRLLEGLDLYFVVLAPGTDAALERDRTRDKSMQYREEHGISIAERWAHLDELFRRELRGFGLWVDNGSLSPDETVRTILAHRQLARLPARVDQQMEL